MRFSSNGSRSGGIFRAPSRRFGFGATAIVLRGAPPAAKRDPDPLLRAARLDGRPAHALSQPVRARRADPRGRSGLATWPRLAAEAGPHLGRRPAAAILASLLVLALLLGALPQPRPAGRDRTGFAPCRRPREAGVTSGRVFNSYAFRRLPDRAGRADLRGRKERPAVPRRASSWA